MSAPWSHPWLSALMGDPQIAAILSPEAELARMLRIEAAWTRTIAPAPEADRIAARIEGADIAPADLAPGTAQDGLPVPALVALLRAALPEGDRRWLHRGLTSQDVIDTALMLALAEALPILAHRLQALVAALEVLAARDGARPLMAATRMQPALPVTAGHRIAAWTRPLRDIAGDLPALRARLAVLQWGGPVGLRDPDLPGDTGARMAGRLGLSDPGHAWHSDRRRLAQLAAMLAQISGALGKMGQDIALMAQTGPDALRLDGGGGSSAMPHKQNPVLAELLVTLARLNSAGAGLIQDALVHEQERSGAAWMVEWATLPQMLIATGAGLNAGLRLVGMIRSVGADQSGAGQSGAG